MAGLVSLQVISLPDSLRFPFCLVLVGVVAAAAIGVALVVICRRTPIILGGFAVVLRDPRELDLRLLPRRFNLHSVCLGELG